MAVLVPFALLLAPAAVPQETEVLLVEGLPLPGSPLLTVTSLNNPAVNAVGGWCAEVNLDDGVAALGAVYGTGTGAGPSLLVIEGTYGSYLQTSYESFLGLDSFGVPAYSPLVNDLVGGGVGLDAAWYGPTPVAIEGDPILSLPGKVFRFNSRVDVISNTGEPVWVGGINDAGGAVEGNGLFRGFGQTAVLKEGDVVPNILFPLDSSAIDFDFRFSPSGTHYITGVDVATGSTTNDFHVVMDGAGLLIGGVLAQEGVLLPAALQVDPAEAWFAFDSFGAADDGSYLITGDTNGPLATDEFVLVDGAIVQREGSAVGPYTINGAIESAHLSAREDVGVVWDVDLPAAGGNVEALFFNGRVVLREGDTIEVDVDGDMLTEVGTVRDFTGIATVVVGADRALYTTLDVDTLGTSSTTDDTELLVRVAVPDLAASADTLSVSAGGTVDFTLFTPRDVEADLYLLAGSTSGTVPGLVVDGFPLPLNVDAYTLFSVTTPNHAPLAGNFGFVTDALGVEDASFSLPAASDPAFAGVTVSHAYITLRLSPFALVTHASNAVDVLLVP
ncbi:MAG TPA: hypothetical protein VJP77_07955 [Planctomycetota bacterium]|nr:hypothetical protein [Planctomycetota bacterium]